MWVTYLEYNNTLWILLTIWSKYTAAIMLARWRHLWMSLNFFQNKIRVVTLTKATNPSFSACFPARQLDCQHTGKCHSRDRPSNPRISNILAVFDTKLALFALSVTSLEYFSPFVESVHPPRPRRTLIWGFWDLAVDWRRLKYPIR